MAARPKLSGGKKKLDGWYWAKRYPHFDKPLTFREASRYVRDARAVESHGFLPFLAFDKVLRRYRTEKIKTIDADGRERTSKRRIPCDPKLRPLRITPHVDGYIYAFYAKNLSQRYEQIVASANLQKHVLAYRARLGTNVSFAKVAFDAVSRRRNCVAVAFDLSKFFDSIDHNGLKSQWCRVLGERRLPSDHHAVFRAITKYSTVSMGECLKRLNVKRRERSAAEGLCSIGDFRTKVRGGAPSLVVPNPDSFGIPQGSPISALLSNIFMLPFDEAMHSVSVAQAWEYFRYCDDILVIGPPGSIETIINEVRGRIAQLPGTLAINEDKTEAFEFVESDDGMMTIVPQDGRSIALPLQYLGFTFDGRKIRIRSSSVSRYWRKLIKGARATKLRAKRRHATGKSGGLLKYRVYENSTHLGARNFYSYAKKAKRTFGRKMPRPLRNHFSRLQKELL